MHLPRPISMSLQALIITGQPTDTSNTENIGTLEELILSPGTSTNTLECNDQRRAAEAFNNNPTSPVAAIAIVACLEFLKKLHALFLFFEQYYFMLQPQICFTCSQPSATALGTDVSRDRVKDQRNLNLIVLHRPDATTSSLDEKM
ncbi:uncharacterized protein PADG_12414 [Paracoccidioides brasiliensis Pb18]|uniref:Uncharacterized protein n=1 Tax=Paracoccidioides brasiliensis (strain Pb18) TaxID=502780 RepID=A0A0A0HS64_PARBD|nr:uncharacterized protein PADG_12414 [Paracoccidioides brasiliensis Pb18]KGM91502.1 hypothetical protein PADG_12414 [Paracoccidioides brasiliensis Pb18]